MACKLPNDCLSEIFECLEDDKFSLHSCLLISRPWCEIAVRFLWKNIWDFPHIIYSHVSLSILSTLTACLPRESRDLLYTNGIFIPTPTSETPFFNYISFARVLIFFKIDRIIENVLKNRYQQIRQISTSRNLDHKKLLVSQELLKAFMSQIPSLKTLDCLVHLPIFQNNFIKNVPFICFPGVKDCLTDLSILKCNSDASFFYQLSQICHHIQSINIIFEQKLSDGLIELILLQNNLKSLKLVGYDVDVDWTNFIPAFTKHSNTLTNLCIYSCKNIPLSFITSFINLQELVISRGTFKDFDESLSHATFPNLRILSFPDGNPKAKSLTKLINYKYGSY